MRLNWGSGAERVDGWLGVDKVDYGWNIVSDITTDPLPWGEGYFDMIVANHSLSDLTFHELPGALSELYRVLKPGGVLRVLVPDFDSAMNAYVLGLPTWFPQGDDLTDIDERFCTFVTWFGTVGSVFTPGYLSLLLQRAGFDGVAKADVGWTFRSSPPEITSLDGDRTTSLIMEGVK